MKRLTDYIKEENETSNYNIGDKILIEKEGDEIIVRPKSQKTGYFTELDNVINDSIQGPLSWLKSDGKKMTIKIVGLPKREEAETGINEQLIVEYYSR